MWNEWFDKITDMIPTVSCREATRLASEALDRRLSFKEWLDLRGHTFVCTLCLRFNIQIRGMQKTLRSYPNRLSTTAEKKLPEEFKLQIRQKLG